MASDATVVLGIVEAEVAAPLASNDAHGERDTRASLEIDAASRLDVNERPRLVRCRPVGSFATPVTYLLGTRDRTP